MSRRRTSRAGSHQPGHFSRDHGAGHPAAFAAPRRSTVDLWMPSRHAASWTAGRLHPQPLISRKVRQVSRRRVQSVAVRLVVEARTGDPSFVAREYWTIEGRAPGAGRHAVTAELVGSAAIGRRSLTGTAGATPRRSAPAGRGRWCHGQSRRNAARRDVHHVTLQQRRAAKLGFSPNGPCRSPSAIRGGRDARRIRFGLITYMRRIQVVLSSQALAEARDSSTRATDRPTSSPTGRRYRTYVRNAQEAARGDPPHVASLAPYEAGWPPSRVRLPDQQRVGARCAEDGIRAPVGAATWAGSPRAPPAHSGTLSGNGGPWRRRRPVP